MLRPGVAVGALPLRGVEIYLEPGAALLRRGEPPAEAPAPHAARERKACVRRPGERTAEG